MDIRKLTIDYRNQNFEIEYFIRPGKGSTLLYLHGGGCSKNDFLEATKIPELRDYQIMAFDFPGCGNSPYPAHLDIDDLVEITDRIISILNLTNVILLGHSMGGLIGLLYIQRHNHIKAFINIEGNLASENCVFSRKVVGAEGFEDYLRILEQLKESLNHSKNLGFEKWSSTLEHHSSPQAFYDYCPQIVEYSDQGNLVELYSQLKIPTLYIYGSENEHKLHFLKTLKNSGRNIKEISQSNHFPFYDNPHDFFSIISDFLKSLPRA